MLIYDETVRVLNEDWAYIAKVYDEEPRMLEFFVNMNNFQREYELYVGSNIVVDELQIIKRPAWEYGGVLQKPSLVMKFKRYEGDGI
ncbi:MAG TPA: hypothetical protein VGK47_11435 [Nitrososphaeraceae archaeon]